MNASIITRTNGNTSSITIKRSMSFKIVHCPTTELERTVRQWVIYLSNLGYNVS